LLSFLPDPPVSRTLYSRQELDSARGYVVLAHAEIEAFCEDIVLSKVQRAESVFQTTGRVTPVLRKLLSYHVGKNRRSWSEVQSPSSNVVEAALQSHTDIIRANHGIKINNLEKLFYPIGVLETELDAAWLAAMDSFGARRGGMAHSSVAAGFAPDPLTELNAVIQLLSGLLKLDRILAKLQ
jgi:hypothetical protein